MAGKKPSKPDPRQRSIQSFFGANQASAKVTPNVGGNSTDVSEKPTVKGPLTESTFGRNRLPAHGSDGIPANPIVKHGLAEESGIDGKASPIVKQGLTEKSDVSGPSEVRASDDTSASFGVRASGDTPVNKYESSDSRMLSSNINYVVEQDDVFSGEDIADEDLLDIDVDRFKRNAVGVSPVDDDCDPEDDMDEYLDDEVEDDDFLELEDDLFEREVEASQAEGSLAADLEDLYAEIEEDDETLEADGAASSKPARTIASIFSGKGWSRKKRKTAAVSDLSTWMRDQDALSNIDPACPEVIRFRNDVENICSELSSWAWGVPENWRFLPREDREMTIGFWQFFRNRSPKRVAEDVVGGIPLQVQYTFGKGVDSPETLLGALQVVPKDFQHRLVYLNLATKRPIEDVVLVRGKGRYRRRAVRPGASSKIIECKLYNGSSNDTKGGGVRVDTHYDMASPDMPFNLKRHGNEHYGYIRQDDVVCHFVMLAAWENPYVAGQKVMQDLHRPITVACEAIWMTYLNLYHASVVGSRVGWKIFTRPSLDLSQTLRAAHFPKWSKYSLNMAWPFVQGVGGGFKRTLACAGCGRVSDQNTDVLCPGSLRIPLRGIPGSDQLEPKYCHVCIKSWQKRGVVNARLGRSTGRIGGEREYAAINGAWLGNHLEKRKCHNPNCGVPIHHEASLYGVENGIRCKRCHDYVKKYQVEWSSMNGKIMGEKLDCQQCDKTETKCFRWEKMSRDDADGPERLCEQCYIVKCSFLTTEPVKDQRHTVACCGNVGCEKRGEHDHGSKNNLIEDRIAHLWRCLGCDWWYSTYQVDFPAKRDEDPDILERSIGPLVHHRFNETSCAKCGSCVTWDRRWAVNPQGGGWICAACNGVRCQNPSCPDHPAMTFSLSARGENQGLLCERCLAIWTMYGTERERLRNVSAIPPTRRCANPACTATGLDPKVFWMWTDGEVRCRPCHEKFARSGEDRDYVSKPTHKLSDEERDAITCHGCHKKGDQLRAEDSEHKWKKVTDFGAPVYMCERPCYRRLMKQRQKDKKAAGVQPTTKKAQLTDAQKLATVCGICGTTGEEARANNPGHRFDRTEFEGQTMFVCKGKGTKCYNKILVARGKEKKQAVKDAKALAQG